MMAFVITLLVLVFYPVFHYLAWLYFNPPAPDGAPPSERRRRWPL